jgi:exopolyphosphatase / guanosine-5'-triphosphate,3'-diphosphate pyrophosphatase
VTAPPTATSVAAVDLGSNSFHMVVARAEEGRLTVLDRIKERVQIAAGLDEEGAITEDAQERALACLEKFGQRLRDMPTECVRAVGTNTLRRATNARAFVKRAHRALGHPIEVVSGKEEARLIYLGVAHDTHHGPARRLVVDVGGGST